MELVVSDLRGGYYDVVNAILDHGREVSPRGYKTWELEDATVVVENCRELLPVGVGRNPKLAIAAAEAVGLCAGLDVTDLCVSVSKTFRRFLDGSNLWGQYGKRVRGQMETVVRRLRSDADTRQAIVTIWDPAYDQVDARDLPCTLGFGFRIRDGELHMSARMRSQDAFLGLGYDAFFFGQLGWTVGNVLGLPLGRLCVKVDSLHVYERNVEQVERMHPYDGTQLDEPTGFGYEFGRLWNSPNYEHYRKRAELVYNESDMLHETASERWYRDVLGQYDRLTRVDNFSS